MEVRDVRFLGKWRGAQGHIIGRETGDCVMVSMEGGGREPFFTHQLRAVHVCAQHRCQEGCAPRKLRNTASA